MSDNPFAEPDDSDRTIVRGPVGGASRPIPVASAVPRAVAAGGGPAFGANARPPADSAPRLAGGAEELPKVGIGPLAAAAAPLLDLLARLANAGVANQPNADELRERAVRALRRFETDAREAGAGAEQIRAAHYMLCASLDDVVLATPWGVQSTWSTRSLVSTFHQEVKSGDRFFDVLAGMQKEPGRWLGAMEVAYVCLALGFQGRYRLSPRGAAELDRMREGLYQLLVQVRGAWERDLSPHWRGVDAPHRGSRRGVPSWVAACVAVFGLGVGYAWLARSMNVASDGLYERMASLPPARAPEVTRATAPAPPTPAPVRPGPAQPDTLGKLRQFLKPEIDAGLVTVFGDRRSVTVRVRGGGMFASARTDVLPQFNDLLTRIGAALRDEPGRVLVVGHSDNQPIRSVRFPSNFHLSAARAEAAMRTVALAARDAGRFTAEGRADAEPIADNATAEGREANRRIEVVLTREDG